ncbi:Uncharacterised protein [Vibrio cholerae]|nr:Uncharacterised protein [Vibrio cholerae]
MPARTARAPRGFPCWFTRFRHFPEHEIQRTAFCRFDIHTCSRLELIKILLGKFTVLAVLAHFKHHITVISNISKTTLNQALNQSNDLFDISRRTWFNIGTFDIQGIEIRIHFLNQAFCQ